MDGWYHGNLGYSKEFKLEGVQETLDAFQQLANEIGDKKATSKFLVPAMKMALMPVLAAAKQLVSQNTGKLHDSLIIYAKRPTNKDRRSKYIGKNDAVIAKVETKPISAREERDFKATKQSLSTKGIKVTRKAFFEGRGRFYDGRAIANEFGTAKRGAKPFLRPAMEGQAQTVIDILSIALDQKIRQYRSKTAK